MQVYNTLCPFCHNLHTVKYEDIDTISSKGFTIESINKKLYYRNVFLTINGECLTPWCIENKYRIVITCSFLDFDIEP